MNKSTLIIILSCLTLSLIMVAKVDGFKMAIFTSGDVNDFGFNDMINRAKVQVEKALNTTDVDIYENINETYSYPFMESLIAQGYDSIIAASLEYTTATINISNAYPNIVAMARGNRKPTKNMSFVTYNIGVCQYLMGYFAGLMTQTNILGFVNPGLPFIANYNANAFYLGARAARPGVNLTLHLYNSGDWATPDIEAGATNELIALGCDIISHTQDDMTVPQTIMKHGLMAIGTNGFPQREIYGEQIGVSFVTDWASTYIRFAKSAMTNRTDMFNVYGDLINNFLYLDQFSIHVNQTVRDAVNAEVLRLRTQTNTTVNPYFCDDLNFAIFTNKSLFLTPTSNCIKSSTFFAMNLPYPGMIYHGYYTVPLVKVDTTNNNEITTTQYAFSIVSGILIAICLVCAIGVYYYRNTHSIRSSSPIFTMAILIGGMLTYAGVIVWVQSNNDAVCNARYYLLAVGYALFIGSLVVKNFRIWLIFDNPELKAIKITNQQLFPWVFGIICIKIILLAIMTSSVGNNGAVNVFNIDGLTKYEYMSVCQMSDAGNGVLIGILASFAALLLLGVFVSWKIRIVDIEEFNESKAIANTLYAISFCLFVIVPLMVSPQSQQSQKIIICTAALFITTSALFILFVPKFYRIYVYGKDSSADVFSKRTKSSIASSRSKSQSQSNGIVDEDDAEEDLNTSRTNTYTNTNTGSKTVVGPDSITLSALPPYTGPVHATFESDDEAHSNSRPSSPVPPPQEV